MQHNIKKILELLNEGLEREVAELVTYTSPYEQDARNMQLGRTQGIEMAISWIENNITK